LAEFLTSAIYNGKIWCLRGQFRCWRSPWNFRVHFPINQGTRWREAVYSRRSTRDTFGRATTQVSLDSCWKSDFLERFRAFL